MSIARKILIDELIENSHIEKVEDVIFWALEMYAKKNKKTNGVVVSYSIKERIKDAEINKDFILQNPEAIELLNL